MTVAIKPLNLAELLAQNQELEMNQARMARAQREEERQLRLSEALGRYKYGTPEYIQELGKFDSNAASNVQNAQNIQERQHQQFQEHELDKFGQIAARAVESFQRTKDWEGTKQSLLPMLDQMGLSQYKQQFMTATPEATMRVAELHGKWKDPQLQQQQEIDAAVQKQQALMPGQIELARQTSAMRQTGSQPRMSLPQGYRLNPDTGAAERIPGLPVDQPKQAKLPPMSAIKGYQENHSNILQIDRALDALDKNPNAVGLLKSMTPDAALQRFDPEGVDARAKIADIGSMVIHERSGAAVTAAEYPRLKPFIPKVGDSPETISKKLENFRANYEQIQQDYEDTYNEDTGYQLPKLRDASGKKPTGTGSSKYRIGQKARFPDGSVKTFTERGWQ